MDCRFSVADPQFAAVSQRLGGSANRPKSDRCALLIVVFVVVPTGLGIAWGAVWYFGSGKRRAVEKHDAISESAVLESARRAVLESLLCPSTAKFPRGSTIKRCDETLCYVSVPVDAQNAFGAYLRKALVVEVKMIGGYPYDARCLTEKEAAALVSR